MKGRRYEGFEEESLVCDGWFYDRVEPSELVMVTARGRRG